MSGLSSQPPTSLSPHSSSALLGIGSSHSTPATSRVNAVEWQSTRQSQNSSLALCTSHICGADAQLGALGMQGARLIAISSHLYILTPSSPLWTSQHILTIYSLLKKIPSPW